MIETKKPASFPDEKDQEVSDAFRFTDEEGKEAAQKAMNLLLHKDRTRQELVDRLYRAGFSEQASGEALQYVEQFGYINDRRYTENYIMFQKEKKSRKEIVYQLTGRGIEKELVLQVLEEGGYDGEEAAIKNLVEKKLKGHKISSIEYEERQKIMAYIARKGYDFGLIKKVFSQLSGDLYG